MKKTYKKTTIYTGKVNKYVKEWMEQLKNDVLFDETYTDLEGNNHRMRIRDGKEFGVKMGVEYHD